MNRPMSKRDYLIPIFVVIFLLIAFIIFGGAYYLWNTQKSVKPIKHLRKTDVPIVLVAGSNNSWWSTNQIRRTFIANDWSVGYQKLEVSQKGKISVMHPLKPHHKNAVIQLHFAGDSPKNGYAEGKRMAVVGKFLQNHDHFKKINIEGDSMGANVAYYYLTHLRNFKQQPLVSHFVSFSSNYDSQEAKEAKYLPRSLNVLNIVGEIFHYGSDGEVSNASSRAMGKMVKKYVHSYKYIVMRGDPINYEHSALHENPSLIRQIAKYLYAGKKPQAKKVPKAKKIVKEAK